MARLILKLRIPILLAIPASFVLLKIAAPPLAFDSSVESMIDADDPALATLYDFRDIFGSEEDIFVGIEADDAFHPEVLAAIADLSEQLDQIDHVEHVVSVATGREIIAEGDLLKVSPLMPSVPKTIEEAHHIRDRVLGNRLFHNRLTNADGSVSSLLVQTRVPDQKDGQQDFRAKLTDETRRIVDAACATDAIRACHVVGAPILKMDLVRMSQHDHRWFLPISAILILLVLALVFRSLAAVFLSVIAVAISLDATQSLFSLSGRLVNMVTVIITPLILVIGLTCAIHLFSRYGEMLRQGFSKQEALTKAIHHVGLASVLTSVTTAAGFLSLVVSPVIPIREFGVFAAIGIMLTLVVTMSIIPAALSLLPPPRISRAIFAERSWTGHFVSWTSTLVHHHRRKIAWVSAGVATLAIVGITRIEVETYLIRFFPNEHAIYRAYMFINENLSGAAPLEVLFRADEPDTFKDPAVLEQVDAYRAWLESRDEPGKVMGLTDLLKEINRAMHGGAPEAHRIPHSREAVAQYVIVYESAASDDPELYHYVTDDFTIARLSARLHLLSSSGLVRLFDDLVAFRDAHPIEGVRVEITGASILYANMVEKLLQSQMRSFALALVVIFLVMSLLFRSLRLGLVAMIPNLIPISIAAGVMGWVGIPLTIATAMIASVAIGIAVDDTIHFLVRFKEEMSGNHNDYLAACQRVLVTTGRPVIFTSLVISAGFVILVISSFRPNVEFGLLTATAMMAAMLADLTVTPAVLIFFKPLGRSGKREQ